MSNSFRRLAAGIVVALLAITALTVWLGRSPLFDLAKAPQAEPLSSEAAGVATVDQAAARLVSARELIENARELDGQWVRFEGEAIGEVMVRGETAWVNVADADYAIGVLLPAAQADKVLMLGNYRTFGDRVRVTGVFHRADSRQGGDLDIVATELVRLAAGSPRSDTRPAGRVFWAGGLALIALAVFVAVRARARGHEAGSGSEQARGFEY
ncbi:MAG: hypothetical protein ACYC5Y_07025 [Symbiobacteriia bacterium]